GGGGGPPGRRGSPPERYPRESRIGDLRPASFLPGVPGQLARWLEWPPAADLAHGRCHRTTLRARQPASYASTLFADPPISVRPLCALSRPHKFQRSAETRDTPR